MNDRAVKRRALRWAWSVIAVCFITVLGSAKEQSAQAQNSNENDKSPRAYEIVSIRQNNSEQAGGSFEVLPDGSRATRTSLQVLIWGAYGIVTESQISGMPGWANDTYYDVTAKADAETTKAWKKMPQKERRIQEQLMWRLLLADRFQLKFHTEMRKLPVYQLVIAKGGSKMKESSADEQSQQSWGLGKVRAQGADIGALANGLSGTVGRMIIDDTGLKGKYDFTLEWTPNELDSSQGTKPSIFTALQEQLGLKLVPKKGPANVIVIDHLEKPSPN